MAYLAVRALFWALFRLTSRWRVHGAERLPVSGPAIVCANHLHWSDPCVVACSVNRRIYFMAKSELFRNPVMARVFRAVGAFPVNRGRPDRRAIRDALAILARGDLLGIFPEGTRSRDGKLREAELGVGMLASRSGALVVPMAIVTPYRPFRELTLRIGEPFTAVGDRRHVASMTMEAIGGMMGGSPDDSGSGPCPS